MKAARPFGRFLAPAFRARLLSVVTLCGACLFATAASQSAHVNSLATQEFFCYAGLDHHECLQNIAKLRAELVRYSADLPERWSWVIIGSENSQAGVYRPRRTRNLTGRGIFLARTASKVLSFERPWRAGRPTSYPRS